MTTFASRPSSMQGASTFYGIHTIHGSFNTMSSPRLSSAMNQATTSRRGSAPPPPRPVTKASFSLPEPQPVFLRPSSRASTSSSKSSSSSRSSKQPSRTAFSAPPPFQPPGLPQGYPIVASSPLSRSRPTSPKLTHAPTPPPNPTHTQLSLVLIAPTPPGAGKPVARSSSRGRAHVRSASVAAVSPSHTAASACCSPRSGSSIRRARSQPRSHSPATVLCARRGERRVRDARSPPPCGGGRAEVRSPSPPPAARGLLASLLDPVAEPKRTSSSRPHKQQPHSSRLPGHKTATGAEQPPHADAALVARALLTRSQRGARPMKRPQLGAPTAGVHPALTQHVHLPSALSRVVSAASG